MEYLGQIFMDEVNIEINFGRNKHDHVIHINHWPWRGKETKKANLYSRVLSSKLKSCPSQWAGNWNIRRPDLSVNTELLPKLKHKKYIEIQSSELPRARGMWSYWRETRKESLRWLGDWSLPCMRKDWRERAAQSEKKAQRETHQCV